MMIMLHIVLFQMHFSLALVFCTFDIICQRVDFFFLFFCLVFLGSPGLCFGVCYSFWKIFSHLKFFSALVSLNSLSNILSTYILSLQLSQLDILGPLLPLFFSFSFFLLIFSLGSNYWPILTFTSILPSLLISLSRALFISL